MEPGHRPEEALTAPDRTPGSRLALRTAAASLVLVGARAEVGQGVPTLHDAPEARQSLSIRNWQEGQAVLAQKLVEQGVSAIHELAAGLGVEAIVERRPDGLYPPTDALVGFQDADRSAGPHQREGSRQPGQPCPHDDDAVAGLG